MTSMEFTPLIAAVTGPNEKTVHALIQAGANVNFVAPLEDRDITALSMAAYKGQRKNGQDSS